ncbi:transcription factor HES-1-like [Lineus longissimus]|uniref:transcription factor HES-1-like n=1 Tax=Lineus longissimus TaxID=88925 RepID=UPI00315DC461
MTLQGRENDNDIMYDFDRAVSPTDSLGENRKMNKPLIEKRRRARINNSLSQLKMLVVGVLNKQTSPKNKLEKADVLEMTVKYIRNIQKQQVTAAATTDSDVINKYKSGFYTCAQEVTSFLTKENECIDESTKLKLLDHLANCMQSSSCREGADKGTKRTQREGKVHLASPQQKLSKSIASSPYQMTTRGLHQTPPGQENAPLRRHPLRQAASPLSTINQNCLSLTPPPSVSSPKLHPSNSYADDYSPRSSPVLLSNQGGSWTRVSYPGGAASFNRNNTSAVDIPVSSLSSPADGYQVCSPEGQFAQKTSPLQGEVPSPLFYHDNGFGLNVRQPDGGDVWRPW